MTTTGGAPFEDFADLLGLPELLDPRFATSEGRTEHIKELDELVSNRMKELDPLELFHKAQKRRFVFGVCQTPKDILDCPQMAAREFFQSVNHPVVGTLKYPGGPFRMSETPAQMSRPAPLLGQHTREVLETLGYDKDSILRLTEMEVI
jgi:crotonobetainyl-CoA:carnitine CoA-transferase CaiB-like acyl-CoA transferase